MIDALEFYRGRSLEWFVGTPTFAEKIALYPNESPFRGPVEPFRPPLVMRFDWHRAGVFAGDRLVCLHCWGGLTTVYTLPAFEGRGIATALAYEAAIRDPGQRHSLTRTPGGHRVYCKVYELIQAAIVARDQKRIQPCTYDNESAPTLLRY